jgi:elongation factor 1-beta
MAKVLAAIKVNPADENVDLDKLVEKIKEVLPKEYEVVKHEKVYVAFGLYILRIYVVMPEELEGGTSDIENYLNKIPEVASIDIEYVTRTEAF